MIYLLDTNTVSHIVRGRSLEARTRLAATKAPHLACISSITEGEIRYGLAKIGASAKLIEGMNLFLERIRILPWHSEEAQAYGDLRSRMEKTGKPLGNLDMLIAAHAVAVGAILVTADKAFRQVKGLRGIENWATDL